MARTTAHVRARNVIVVVVVALVILGLCGAGAAWAWDTYQGRQARHALDPAWQDFDACAVGTPLAPGETLGDRFGWNQLSDRDWPERCAPFSDAVRRAARRAQEHDPADVGVELARLMRDRIGNRPTIPVDADDAWAFAAREHLGAGRVPAPGVSAPPPPPPAERAPIRFRDAPVLAWGHDLQATATSDGFAFLAIGDDRAELCRAQPSAGRMVARCRLLPSSVGPFESLRLGTAADAWPPLLQNGQAIAVTGWNRIAPMGAPDPIAATIEPHARIPSRPGATWSMCSPDVGRPIVARTSADGDRTRVEAFFPDGAVAEGYRPPAVEGPAFEAMACDQTSITWSEIEAVEDDGIRSEPSHGDVRVSLFALRCTATGCEPTEVRFGIPKPWSPGLSSIAIGQLSDRTLFAFIGETGEIRLRNAPLADLPSASDLVLTNPGWYRRSHGLEFVSNHPRIVVRGATAYILYTDWAAHEVRAIELRPDGRFLPIGRYSQ